MTSPPSLLTSPTVVIPNCPCGIAAANSEIVTSIPHSTEIPVIPLDFVHPSSQLLRRESLSQLYTCQINSTFKLYQIIESLFKDRPDHPQWSQTADN